MLKDGESNLRIAGKLEQHRRMLPELLEFVNERVLQLVERREHGIGEVLADMPEDLLSRVQFGTIRWQIERVHSRWPADLGARDDCPNCPSRPQSDPCPTHDEDAARRAPGIGPP